MSALVFGSPAAARQLEADRRIARYIGKHGESPFVHMEELRRALRDLHREKRVMPPEFLPDITFGIDRALAKLAEIQREIGETPIPRRYEEYDWD